MPHRLQVRICSLNSIVDFIARLIIIILRSRILAKKLNVPWRKLSNFAELQIKMQTNLEDIITQVDKLLSKEVYTRQDVLQELEITSSELDKEILTPNTIHLDEFKLRQRALHVFQGRTLR